MAQPGDDRQREETDRRYMAAAIRLSRRHLGLTATNPSVATLIVRHEAGESRVVGRGVTAVGGRPHAETIALEEAAGGLARGATAYVTLEPCAHHGRTPPCAEALVSAGVSRVVGAASDPDPRVSGRGYAILREAGIEVCQPVLAREAADLMAGYLIRSVNKRPEVTLKLAVSADGMIGRAGEGQVSITGAIARGQVHLMRAEADAIMIGVGTAIVDDPLLTCRLPGLADRSPLRIVLDPSARLPVSSKLASSAQDVPVMIAATAEADPERLEALAACGVSRLAVETYQEELALPELLEDIAAQGITTVMVEGGARTASTFLRQGLVDRLCLFTGPAPIGEGGIASPVRSDTVPKGFGLRRRAVFGDTRYAEFARII
jgi:diaminohydroxyphosphoribosylaminopyrimidine deaminase / 5-amino-6-(5-phosphoribosylamino)uracil reductase